MSACDPLIKPVVLLSELLDKNGKPQIGAFSSENLLSSAIKWIPLEQTEPLNLSVNGQLIPVVKFYIDGAQITQKVSEDNNDDDVIFVKEYKPINRRRIIMEEKSISRRRSLKNSNQKGEPRRNPIRKARNAKRFKEFTSLDDEDFTNESEDDECPTITLNSSGEDAQDWNENDLKRAKPKRKALAKKPANFVRTGRRRKFANIANVEKKESLGDLEDLVRSNLVLLKDFVKNVDSCSAISGNGNHKSGIRSSAMEMVKNQALLLAITKNVKDLDVLNFLK